MAEKFPGQTISEKSRPMFVPRHDNRKACPCQTSGEVNIDVPTVGGEQGVHFPTGAQVSRFPNVVLVQDKSLGLGR